MGQPGAVPAGRGRLSFCGGRCAAGLFFRDRPALGNPLYDWDYHKETGYDWWIRRIQGQIRLVDYVRIDHFRGFEAYYAIPYGAETAVEGEWRPGPGVDLFQKIREVFGEEIPIWAEDLGIITDEVEALRDGFDLPGMKVLQFAFEDPKDNDMMPYRFTTSNCICYTGTHDNATTMGWYLELPEKTRDRDSPLPEYGRQSHPL